MSPLLSLLLLSAVAGGGDWYRVRMTAYTPDCDGCTGWVRGPDERARDVLARGECVLAADLSPFVSKGRKYPAPYRVGEVFEVRLPTGTRECVVRDEGGGIDGPYELDLLVGDEEFANGLGVFYPMVRKVRR